LMMHLIASLVANNNINHQGRFLGRSNNAVATNTLSCMAANNNSMPSASSGQQCWHAAHQFAYVIR